MYSELISLYTWEIVDARDYLSHRLKKEWKLANQAVQYARKKSIRSGSTNLTIEKPNRDWIRWGQKPIELITNWTG